GNEEVESSNLSVSTIPKLSLSGQFALPICVLGMFVFTGLDIAPCMRQSAQPEHQTQPVTRSFLHAKRMQGSLALHL
ncbi:MAG: hypothetical protein QNL57_01810, partial [Alphaproteobacteria bacterium]